MGISVNELRIGNLVSKLEEQSIYEWGLGDFELIHDGTNAETSLAPIPLTEEWLDKLGFVKYSDNNPDGGIHYRLGVFSVGVWDNGKDIRFTNIVDGRRLKYVHKLQNMYFELEGEELTIK